MAYYINNIFQHNFSSHKSKNWKNTYAGVEHELQRMPDWPLLSNDRFSSSSSSPFSCTSPEQLSPTIRMTIQQPNGTILE